MSNVAETWWDAGGIFACPDTDLFSGRCQNREEHSPLAIHISAFVHVLVLLAAGLALCYVESNNLTCSGSGIKDERERLVTASPVMTKSRAPAGGNNYPENGLVKPLRRDTRALSPAGMFGGKVPLRLAAQKSRPHAPSVPMRSTPAYFPSIWGV